MNAKLQDSLATCILLSISCYVYEHYQAFRSQVRRAVGQTPPDPPGTLSKSGTAQIKGHIESPCHILFSSGT